MNQQQKIEHFFRHEYGNLVAMLSHRVGIKHIDKIEDAIQWAMAQALEFWSKDKIPTQTFAWLYKVAYRHLLSNFRTDTRQDQLLSKFAFVENEFESEQESIEFSHQITDSMLRMMIVACNKAIPIESQLVFTLKCLCGFSVKEISMRLFLTEANVYKRFSRAKQHLRNNLAWSNDISGSETTESLTAVLHVLYLIFTEGYFSSHPDNAIRKDLCEEAIRLTLLLSESKYGDTPETVALLALMHFHLARINTRQTEKGDVLLLAEQDRTYWDKGHITLAMQLLGRSSCGDKISRYHIEAGIAAEHCLSPSFSETKWEKIIDAYTLLQKVAPSPLHILNQAIATAEWLTPAKGLEVLNKSDTPNWLQQTYYWYTVQADLLFRSGDIIKGKESAIMAIELAPSIHIKQLLNKRLIDNNFS